MVFLRSCGYGRLTARVPCTGGTAVWILDLGTNYKVYKLNSFHYITWLLDVLHNVNWKCQLHRANTDNVSNVHVCSMSARNSVIVINCTCLYSCVCISLLQTKIWLRLHEIFPGGTKFSEWTTGIWGQNPVENATTSPMNNLFKIEPYVLRQEQRILWRLCYYVTITQWLLLGQI